MERRVIKGIAGRIAAGVLSVLVAQGASAASRANTTMTVGATVTASCRIEPERRSAGPSCIEASRGPQSITLTKIATPGTSMPRFDVGDARQTRVLLIRF